MNRRHLLALSIAQLLGAGASQAATLTVDSTADTAADDGSCTLREAIENANSDDQNGRTSVGECAAGSGTDTIALPVGQTITLYSSLPTISADLTVTGNGSEVTSYDNSALNGGVRCNLDSTANGEFRLLNVSAATLSISDLTLSHGCADVAGAGGGAILAQNGALMLTGVTLTANGASTGGAIHAEQSPVTLVDSHASGNHSEFVGGALYIHDAALDVTGGTITGNTAASFGGAALYLAGTGPGALATATLTGVTLSGNTVSISGSGGALRANYADLTFTDCTLSGNSTVSNGGALLLARGSLTLASSRVANNHAGSRTGALDLYNVTATIENSLISGNDGTSRAGGVYAEGGELTLLGSTVSGNAADQGAGIDASGTIVSVTRSTISGNSANAYGGGIALNGGALHLLDSTVANNFAGDGQQLDLTGIDAGSSATRSLVANLYDSGGEGGSGYACRLASSSFGSTVASLESNDTASDSCGFGSVATRAQLDLQPLAFNGGPTPTHALGAASAAVDAGGSCSTTDQRGTAKPVGSACDVGAFELESSAAASGPDFVVNTVIDSNDGICGIAAGDCSLREALGAANADLDASVISFDATVFAGTQTLTLANGQMRIESDVTISGTAAERLIVDAGAASRHFYVARAYAGPAITAQLSNLTLRNGIADSDTDRGGAIYSIESLHLDGVTLSGNQASEHGGGAYVLIEYSGQTLSLHNSVLTGNSATGEGGGLFARLSNGAELTIEASALDGNTATEIGTVAGGGGASISANTGSVQISDSTFDGNTVSGTSARGAGLKLSLFGTSATLNRLDVQDNQATATATTASGAGLSLVTNSGSDTTADTLRISGNVLSGPTTSGAGADLYANTSTLTFGNSTISGNSGAQVGGGVLIEAGGTAPQVEFRDSTISGNTVSIGAGGLRIHRNSGLPTLVMTRSTVTDNAVVDGGSATGGGGVVIDQSLLTLDASVVAGNSDDSSAAASDVLSTSVPTTSNSLVGDNTGSGLSEAQSADGSNNLIGNAAGGGVIDPLLAALADNGGPTLSHLPLTGSPLIDHWSGCSGSDQRGESRGLDGDGSVATPPCDIGAVEFQYTPFTAQDDAGDRLLEDAGSTSLTNVLANEVDPSDDRVANFSVLAVAGGGGNVGSSVGGTGGGAFTIAANGAASFAPQAAFESLDSGESATSGIDYTVSDGLGTDVATLTVTVNGANDAPTTETTSATTTEDASVTQSLPVTDVDVEPQTLSLVSSPAAGTVSVDNDALNFTFDPGTALQSLDDGETQPLSFSYRANDGDADSNVSTVSLTVTGANDAPISVDSSAATTQGTPVTAALDVGDVDVEPLTLATVAAPSAGSVSYDDAALSFTFDPGSSFDALDSGESQLVSFSYKANDGDADSNTSTVTITVDGANDAPVSSDASATTTEDASVTQSLPVNDVDVEPLTLALVAAPAAGTVSFDIDALSFTFDPGTALQSLDDGETQPLSFSYRANDGDADSNVSTVSLTVTGANDAPISVDSSAAMTQGTPVTAALDVGDVDVEPLTLATVAAPSAGSVSYDDAALGFTFDPGSSFDALDSGESQPVSFSFKANDGDVDSNTSTVTITVNGANDAPVSSDVSATTDEDSSVTQALSVTDVDDEAQTLSLVAAPAAGTVSFDNDALSFTFDPGTALQSLDDGETQPLSFSYRANDGDVDSNTSTVSLTVSGANDAPTSADSSAATTQGTPVTAALDVGDVDIESLTLATVAAPSAGSVSYDDAALGFTFDPGSSFDALDSGESQPVSFSFKANDGDVDSNTSTVTITVDGANDAPVSSDASATTDEDSSVTQALSVTDVDDEAQTLSLVAAPAAGTVSFDNDALSFTFDPGTALQSLDDGETQPLSFSYRAIDGDADSNASTVSLTVTGANDAPVAQDDSYTTDAGTVLDVPAASGLLANDSDIDVEPLQAVAGTFTAGGIGGSVELAADGSFRYTPPAGASGIATFDYTVSDGTASATATLSITVTASNIIDLVVSKTDGVDRAAANDVLTYTITVANDGPSDAAGVLIEDLLPPELGNASWSCEAIMPGSATACGNASGSGDIAESVDIAAGDAVVFELMATVDPNFSAGVIRNTATATAPSDRVDTDTGNNSATDTTAADRVFADGFEAAVPRLAFGKREAVLDIGAIAAALPLNAGLKPRLVARADARDGMLRVHARRVGSKLEIRLDRYALGEWTQGAWQSAELPQVQLRW